MRPNPKRQTKKHEPNSKINEISRFENDNAPRNKRYRARKNASAQPDKIFRAKLKEGMSMLFSRLFKPKTQADKKLPVNNRTHITIAHRKNGVTPIAYMFPREYLSLIEYEVPEATTGIHVYYDSEATDSEWAELERQRYTNN